MSPGGDNQVLFANRDLLTLTERSLSPCLAAPMNALFSVAGRTCLQTHVWPTLLRDGRVGEVHLQAPGASGAQTPV